MCTCTNPDCPMHGDGSFPVDMRQPVVLTSYTQTRQGWIFDDGTQTEVGVPVANQQPPDARPENAIGYFFTEVLYVEYKWQALGRESNTGVTWLKATAPVETQLPVEMHPMLQAKGMPTSKLTIRVPHVGGTVATILYDPDKDRILETWSDAEADKLPVYVNEPLPEVGFVVIDLGEMLSSRRRPSESTGQPEMASAGASGDDGRPAS